jgi:hypothetical protein
MRASNGEISLLVLLLVLRVDRFVRERHVDDWNLPGGGHIHRSDEYFRQLNDDVILVVRSLFYSRKLTAGNVLALREKSGQLRVSGVQLGYDIDRVHCYLTRARALRSTNTALRASAPAPGQHSNLVRVAYMLRFALGSFKFQKIIYALIGHVSSILRGFNGLLSYALTPASRQPVAKR